MDRLDSGAMLHYQGVAGNWAADVPIPVDERQITVCPGPEHRGTSFRTRTLYVYRRSYRDSASYRLLGPNIRQDGSEGKFTLGRDITRADAAKAFPGAVAALDAALAEMARRITMDAATAAGEIAATTLNGDTAPPPRP